MNLFLKTIFFSKLKTTVALLFVLPAMSFSQMAPGNSTLQDSAATAIVNDFIVASNTGERAAMQDFILDHFDSNALKRIPLFMVVSLNMQFHYETAGMGYRLLRILPSKAGMVSAELINKLTETTVKFEYPVTPANKIYSFIKTESITPSNSARLLTDSEIIERVEKCLDLLHMEEEFSGAVLFAKNGNVLLKKAIGEASKEYDVKNNTATKFNMASVGKLFTGLAVTKLADQGKLSMEDPVSKYISADWLDPEIAGKIQIKHLLTHTSGLGDYFKDAYAQCTVPFFRNLDDYKFLTVNDTLLFEPGSNFFYSNTGMLLLGTVIENVTKTDYFAYLKSNIFEPAGMLNTDGFDKDVPVKNRATGYTKIFNDEGVSWNNHQFTRILRGSPSGGIYSTIEDMSEFDKAIRSNLFLSPEYSKLLMEGRPELNASFHSYGFFVAEGPQGRVLSHKGDGMGMNSQFKMYLDSGYTYVILSNYSAPSANMLANVIDQLLMHTSEKSR